MPFNDQIKVCPTCHQIVSKRKFLNSTLYLVDNLYLLEVRDKIGRVVGCQDCLNEFISEKTSKFEDRVDYPNRQIYIFNQTKPEKMQTAIKKVAHFFKKRKGQKNDKQTGN